MDYQQALKKLSECSQEHLLGYYNELNEDEKASLLTEIEKLDFSVIERSRNKKFRKGKITPLSVMELEEISRKKADFRETGLKAIREGKVAALILAGGMGTRLGAGVPKGTVDIGITRPVYIFQRQIENMLEVVEAAGVFFPLFIMTSEANHDMTVSFLKEHDYFGYDSEYVMFFTQEKVPCTDINGKVYLEDKGKIASSPNGNGGWYQSMVNSRSYKSMISEKARFGNLEWINVFAVDNVLQRIADPVFTGAVLESGKSCGAKVVRKADPDEKVGVICLEDGHPSIVEYYEITDELRNAVNEHGEPAYNYGVILNYLFRLEDLKKIAGCEIPLHTVKKQIPYLDENGQTVVPETPNGYKYETLALDLIHLFDNCLPFEVDRAYEFAPVKNQTGVDSVESARILCRQNGIRI